MNKKIRENIFLLCCFVLISQLAYTQCTVPTVFSATAITGNCSANASIKVTVPPGNYCAGWSAHIEKGVISSDIGVPTTGGDIFFNSLVPGTYLVTLKNSFTTTSALSVPVTTTYVPMTVTNSFKVPTCRSTAAGYVANGELTVNVPTGGIGPFKYTVSYPTSTTNATVISQTFTSTGGTAADRTHTFVGLAGGSAVTIVVNDLAGGVASCQSSTTQNPTLAANTTNPLTYAPKAYNFVRTTGDCTHPTLFINLSNIDAARDAVISQSGNATITIAGVVYNLTRIALGRWTYDPVASGGPQLENNMLITTKFFWGCDTLQRTSNVVTGDTFIKQTTSVSINSNCGNDYTWNIFGFQDVTVGGLPDRNLFFLENNTLTFEKFENGVWQTVPGESIVPNPNATTNPMGVTGAYTSFVPDATSSFTFIDPGTYRVTASDACHSVTGGSVIFAPVSPLDQVTVAKGSAGVLQGTSGIVVTLLSTLKPNLTIKVSRTDGKTSIPIIATGPLNLAGSYTANFPLTKIITTPIINTSQIFSDLPLGDYTVELSDGCNNFRTLNITLDQAAAYSPVFSTVLGCVGSNKINYNFGKNAAAAGTTLVLAYVKIYKDNGSGGISGTKLQEINALTGTFTNLDAGNYVVQFDKMGPVSISAANITYPQAYTKAITIAPSGGITLETSGILCDPANTNSGIINVELVNDPILNPTTVSLYSSANTTTPIQGPFTLGTSETGRTFTNVPIGNYFIRATNSCTTVNKNITINTGSTGTQPVAKVSRPKVCPADNSTQLAITASSSLYDVTWTDANDPTNVVIGNGTPLTINPTVTKTYKASFVLKPIFNCANNQTFTSTIAVEVTPDLDLTLAVSDIDLCLNSNPNITISNSQSGFTYELTDSKGVSFATPVTALSSGGNVIISIPSTITLDTKTTFKIKVSNDSAGCSGFLTDIVSVTSRKSNQNLIVTGNTVCPGVSSKITVVASETGVTYEVFKNSVSIVSGTGTGANKDFAIPVAQLTAGTNTFTINTSGGGCENGVLANSGIVVVDKAPAISPTILAALDLQGCDISVVPSAVTTVAALESLGSSITDDFTSDASLTVSSTDSGVVGTCPKVITRTYKITDTCNSFSALTQVININDTTIPSISGTLSAITTSGCSILDKPAAMTTIAALEAAGLTISDNCTVKANLTVTSSDGVASGSCPIQFIRTYTIKDACNNSTTIPQLIKITDTTVPVVSGTLTAISVSGCSTSDKPAAMTTITDLETAGLTISDNCTVKANLTLTSSDGVASVTCPITFIRTYTISDACSNSTSVSQLIKITDTSVPVVSGALTAITVSGCSTSDKPAAMTTITDLETAGLAISDNCTAKANLTVTSSDGMASVTCPITFTRTYNLTDSCNNSTSINQIIKIQDTSAPIIIGALNAMTVVGLDTTVLPPAASSVAELVDLGLTSVSDNCADNSTLIISHTDSISTTICPIIVTRTYIINDPCGNSTSVDQTITINTIPATPIIATDSSTTFCEGASVTLTSSYAIGNQWIKNDIELVGDTAPTYTATQTGIYTVVVSNKLGCKSSTSVGVSVTANPLPQATINNGIKLAFVNCEATTIDLTASNGSGFVWYYSPDNITPFSEIIENTHQTISVSDLGYYKVKVTNSSNCESLSLPTQVVATPAVSAAELDTCVGNSISLTTDATSFQNPTYQWNKDGVAMLGQTTQNLDVTQDGVYTITVTDGRNSGNIGTQTSCAAKVKFNSLPVINAGTDFTITCTTNTGGLTIGETPATGFEYVWTSPKGISGLSDASIANPIASPTETTTYTVRKTNQTTGCFQDDSITITVDTTVPTANAGADFTRTCINNTLGKEIGIAPISGVTYSWLPTTGLDDATKANPLANPETTQTYTLTVTNTTNGCFATDTVVATVDVSAPTANAGTDFTKTCATNPTGKLIGAAAVSGETYSWSPLTGLDNATIANPNANPLVTTEYTVTATKTATGCTTTDLVTVTVLDTPNPIALSTTIANNCPVETVDLTTIQSAAVSGIVYEWWTGTATTRGIQITNPTTYSTPGTIYLWSKTTSEGCYNTIPSEVNVIKNVCCMPTVGEILDTATLPYFGPADITSLQHINYPTSSVVRYVVVNNLDGKIKQINTTKPEFTQLKAGNYTVHALVFGPTVVPTGLVVGNKLSQVQPLCGTTATKTIIVQSFCLSDSSFTEILPNAQQYALLDVTTNQFVQVNPNGKFATIYTGMPYQVVGFNYTGTASGIQVGGTLSTVTATNLDVTAGSIVTGCGAVTTEIEGVFYNDKDKNCIEGNNTQKDLPKNILYIKLLNSNKEVLQVTSTNSESMYYFSFYVDLLDGTYSIIVDDNADVTDIVPTYPDSWTGNSQTFTIESGQIVEYLSNISNFIPMCIQSATNKPIPQPSNNLSGNTYNFCQGTITSSLSIDAIPGASLNWYTQATGGSATSVTPVPNTAVVGTTTYYVSQTVNGAESERTELVIDVHALPEQPTMIAGNNLIAAGSIQSYSVVDTANSLTYNWILPIDWTGTSTSKDINVTVGTQAATIGVTAISSMGCVSPVQELAVRVVIEDDIEVYNSISPNGDGDNDVFRIRNIDFYPENTMSIFNRWGIEVYSVGSYGQNDNFFKGFSDGRSTLNRGVELPEGTYFYILTYKNTKGIEKNLSGYLYIKQ